MARRTDTFELGRLGLGAGEARSLDLDVGLEPLEFAGERYEPQEGVVPANLDVARTGGGYSLRLRFAARLVGPCARCLTDANLVVEADAREVDQPGGGEDLESPYLAGDELDLRGWARDALALSLPARILCRDDCRGLCPECGVDLNEADAGHAHEMPPDPRWARLSDLKLE